MSENKKEDSTILLIQALQLVNTKLDEYIAKFDSLSKEVENLAQTIEQQE